MKKGSDIILRLAGRLALPAAIGWAAAPLLWAALCSIRKPLDTFSLSFIPFLQFDPTLEHWREELTSRGPEIRRGMGNSVIVAVCSAMLAVALAAPAAYAVARLSNGRQKRFWWIWFVSQRFLPPVVLLAPYFLICKAAGFLDTRTGLILIHAAAAAPFAAILLQDAFSELPKELEESAAVDGATTWQTFVHIALPLAVPAIAAGGVLCMALSWNEFLYAIVLTYEQAVTMPVLIAGTEHTQGVQFWYVATRSLLALIPPMIAAFIAQRWLVRGLTMGAVKG